MADIENLVSGDLQDVHPLIESITGKDLNAIMNQYDCKEKIQIVDCRYPYEFRPGHIESAVNLFTRESVFRFFLSAEQNETNETTGTTAIVFYCDNSRIRSPRAASFLRLIDKQHMEEKQKQGISVGLRFKKLLLLRGGYKEFFKDYPYKCTPCCCIRKLHPCYFSEYNYYKTLGFEENIELFPRILMDSDYFRPL